MEFHRMRSLPRIEDDQTNEKLQKNEYLKGLTHQNWPQFCEYFSQIWLEKNPPSLCKSGSIKYSQKNAEIYCATS
ncbi:hypothetical protein HZS_6531 [Henneguya salminicola]|nr:hypothetical protein HZS_6531 [Henneguya salminicola]